MTAYSSANSHASHKRDKWIPWYFVLFFVGIAVIDGTFVTLAITTQTGTVTDKAYEKGLAYDDIIEKAALQKSLGITDQITFSDGIITWKLHYADGRPVNDATAIARLFRPAQEGHDFSMELRSMGNGIYQGKPQFPLQGLWMAKVEAQWLNSRSQQATYNATMELVAP